MANIDISIGTSVATANTAISAANPGDVVRFEKGGTYVGQVSFNGVSGSSGNPVILTHYGSGALPILTTRTALPGFSTGGNWTDMGGNVWRKDLAGNSDTSNYRFWLNGTEYSTSENAAGVNSTKRTSYNRDITAHLYVYSTSNPASFYSTIEYNGTDTSALRLSNNAYVTVREIDIRGGTGGTIDIDFADNIIIEDCNIGLDAGRIGIRHNGTCANVIIHDNVIDSGDRIIHDWVNNWNIQDGIRISGGASSWSVYNNWVRDWGHSCIEVSNFEGSITDIEIYDNYLTAEFVDYCRGVGFDSETGRTSTGNKVYRNYIHKTPVQCQLNCPNLEFTYNVINETRNSPTADSGSGRGLSIDGYSNTSPINMKIYNNVISNCESEGIKVGRGASGYGEHSGNEIINNILFNNGASAPFGYNDLQIVLVPNASLGPYTFKNNLLYKSGIGDLYYDVRNTGNEFMTITEFNARNGTNSDVMSDNIGGDPLFTDSDDFTLQDGSPAIEAGLNLGSSYNTGLIESTWPDDVNTAVQASLWNIGSYIQDDLPVGIGAVAFGRIAIVQT